MTTELTGLDYEDWERSAERASRAAELCERTGLLDARHLDEVDRMAEAIIDELEIVDDVRDLSDAQTAFELGAVRRRLAVLRDRIHEAGLRMKRLAAVRAR